MTQTKIAAEDLNIAHEAVAAQLEARVIQARIFYRLAARAYVLLVIAMIAMLIDFLVWRVPGLNWQNVARLWAIGMLWLAWWNLRRICQMIERIYSPRILTCDTDEARRIAALSTTELLKMKKDNIKIM